MVQILCIFFTKHIFKKLNLLEFLASIEMKRNVREMQMMAEICKWVLIDFQIMLIIDNFLFIFQWTSIHIGGPSDWRTSTRDAKKVLWGAGANQTGGRTNKTRGMIQSQTHLPPGILDSWKRPPVSLGTIISANPFWSLIFKWTMTETTPLEGSFLQVCRNYSQTGMQISQPTYINLHARMRKVPTDLEKWSFQGSSFSHCSLKNQKPKWIRWNYCP